MRHVLAVALLLMVGPIVLGQGTEADFYVATDGSDANPGTTEQPFATLAKAQEAVRGRIAVGLDSDLTVSIGGGTYRLEETLVFRSQDSGTNEHAVTYAAKPGEEVVISGGRPITGWKAGPKGVYTARVPGVQEGWTFRHLYVNGRRAQRARTPNRDAENPMFRAHISRSVGRPRALYTWTRSNLSRQLAESARHGDHGGRQLGH